MKKWLFALAGLLAGTQAHAQAGPPGYPTISAAQVQPTGDMVQLYGARFVYNTFLTMQQLQAFVALQNGSVGTGTAGQIPFYAAAGNALTAQGPFATGAVIVGAGAAGLSSVGPFTSGLPIIGAGAGLAAGTKSGNTTEFGTVSGGLTSGNVIISDANHNLVDSGVPPNTSVINPGVAPQLGYYATSGSTISPLPTPSLLNSIFQYLSSAQITDVTTGACTLDLSSAITSALTSAEQLYFPAGTYCVASPIVLNTSQMIVGAGEYATTLQAKAGTATAILQSANYSTLLNGNTAAGPHTFTIANLGINGNKANVTGSANNVQLYAYDFLIQNVISYNAPCTSSCGSGATGDGIFSQWATSAGVPVAAGGNGMEAHIYNFKTFSNAGIGIFWEGPHDTVFTDITTFLNDVGFSCFSASTFLCTANVAGLHSYGNSSFGIAVAGTGGTSNLYGSMVEADSNLSSEGMLISTGATANLTSVWAIGNTGFGVTIVGSGSIINGLFTQANSSDGLTFFNSTATNNLVTNVYAQGNGGWGVGCGGTAGSGNHVISAMALGNSSGQYNTVACSGIVTFTSNF